MCIALYDCYYWKSSSLCTVCSSYHEEMEAVAQRLTDQDGLSRIANNLLVPDMVETGNDGSETVNFSFTKYKWEQTHSLR